MSEAEMSAAPAAETPPPAPEAAPAAEEAAPPVPEAIADHGLADEELAALAGDDDIAPPTTDEPTISIGGHDIPISALSELPDEALKHIRRKVKAAGEEREVSLLEALEAVPKAEGWQKRQWQAAQREKELQQAAKALPEDAIGAVMQLRGVSRGEAVDILAKQLVAELEEAQLPPEERAHRQRMRELEERARKADEYERAQQEQQEQAKTAKARETYLKGIGGALKSQGLPNSKYAIGRVAMVLSGAYDAGVIQGDPTPQDFAYAAEQVAKEYAEERSMLLGEAEGDDLLERVGPDVARRIARAYAKRIKARSAAPEREVQPNGKPKGRRRTQDMDWDEYIAMKNREMGISR